MRKEIKKFLKSNKMVLILPRDYSKTIISQWTTCRSVLATPFFILFSKLAKLIPSSKIVSYYYRLFFGMKIGKNVGFAQIQPDYVLPEAIKIGRGSAIGLQTKILTHEFTQNHQRYGKVKIGKNVLIGAFSVIRGGVKIGDNSLVAMCSFVNKDIPPNELWGGVPAKRIKKLN